MTDFFDEILKWTNIEDVKTTFNAMGFDEVTRKNHTVFVKLDKDRNIILKIIEQDKFKHQGEFTPNIPYVLLIEKYKKFKFIKEDYTISNKLHYLQFKFSKAKISEEDKKRMNEGIQPNNIPKLIAMFGINELDVIVQNLKNILDLVSKLSEEELKNLGDTLNLNSTSVVNIESSAKRVLLVVASAAMFHAKLDDHLPMMKPKIDIQTKKAFKSTWPPKSLQKCYEAENTISELLTSWKLILAVDYAPIFLAGCKALESNKGENFNKIIKEVIEWSKESVKIVSGLKHDILGRLFHIMLEDAKYDGSFYTSVPSAVLLAGIAIKDNDDIPADIEEMKIIDPACGTGTLLMAATERIKNLLKSKYDSKLMIEKVLHGIDINITALHMAATTLGLLSPTTKFKNMNISQAKFGEINDTQAAAGSLELYSDGGLLPHMDVLENSAPQQIDSNMKTPLRQFHGFADLVIMNPPFTRNNLRHDQFDNKTKKSVKEREDSIFKDAPVIPSKTSSGLMFLLLAEKLCNAAGTVACVFPLSFTTGPSAKKTRMYLAKKFHIETLIIPHDPKKFGFSENTNIGELLMVMKRSDEHKPTRLISLAINPNTVDDALKLSEKIRTKKNTPSLQSINIPYKSIINDHWHAVQFYSLYLVKTFENINNGKLFNIIKLNKIANISTNARNVRENFRVCIKADQHNRKTIYGHKTKKTLTIAAKPNAYLIQKLEKNKKNDKKATKAWERGSHLLFPENLQPNKAHVFSLYSDTPIISSTWQAVRLNDVKNNKNWCMAMSLYFNSTPGLISALGIKIPRKLLYPRFSVENYNEMPIPNFSKEQITMLVNEHKKLSNLKIGLWQNYNDPARIEIDKSVCASLELDFEEISKMRFELSREPMCTGKRYAS